MSVEPAAGSGPGPSQAALNDALRAGLAEATAQLDTLTDALADAVADPRRSGSLDADRLHRHGEAAMLLARAVAELRAAQTLLDAYAGRSAALQRLGAYAVARALLSLDASFRAEVAWPGLAGVEASPAASGLALTPAVKAAAPAACGPAALDALWPLLAEGGTSAAPAYALSSDHDDIRTLFRDFADAQVAPLAEEIHRHDALLPESLLSAYAEVGALGITIPERWGGQFIDHRSMAIATEELSRCSLGAGGSVITRPEIASKALLAGGTEAQKRQWLPRIARGQEIVAIAVTEPGAGSDVAAVRTVADRAPDGGWLLTGEKTWCTFAGRASVLLVLARTGSAADGAKGLTLFLVPKPPVMAPADDRSFACDDGRGGTLSGRAIPTVGYRGMHSFTCFLERFWVSDEHRVGDVGAGFALQMKGFAGGRIQTAARAVGVMEAALRAALRYSRERMVFGRSLDSLPICRRKLCDMAARVALARQMTYAVCDAMDSADAATRARGDHDASLVKLLACRDAESVTREAMQLHGGMGYSEEFAVSRYWQDARVLSIFEGAEEVLAVLVIARALLRDRLATRAASADRAKSAAPGGQP